MREAAIPRRMVLVINQFTSLQLQKSPFSGVVPSMFSSFANVVLVHERPVYTIIVCEGGVFRRFST
jgi:hypothetical protein